LKKKRSEKDCPEEDGPIEIQLTGRQFKFLMDRLFLGRIQQFTREFLFICEEKDIRRLLERLNGLKDLAKKIEDDASKREKKLK